MEKEALVEKVAGVILADQLRKYPRKSDLKSEVGCKAVAREIVKVLEGAGVLG